MTRRGARLPADRGTSRSPGGGSGAGAGLGAAAALYSDAGTPRDPGTAATAGTTAAAPSGAARSSAVAAGSSPLPGRSGPPGGTGSVLVSVVVPTFRRPALLDRCLAALAAQDLDPAAYEIVVADDAASEATRRQVAWWAGRTAAAVRYVPVTGGHGPAAARNRGWQAARGAVIAFTDDDTVASPGWLRAGLAAFADGVAGAWGRVVVPLPPVPTDYERDVAGLEAGPFVTANCFYRREALAAVGGFDERFASAWREDSDLYFTLLEQGARLVRAPDAVVVHPVRPAPWGVSLRQQRKNLFNALLYKKHPALYRRRIQAAPPWPYYLAVGALAAAVGGALRGREGLALGAAAAWALLTVRFCARRLRRASHAPHHVAEMLVTSALIPPLAVFWRLRGALRFRVFFL